MTNERPIRNHWCDRCKLAHSACSACGGLTDGGYDAHRASHHFCEAGSSTAPDEDRVYVEPRPVETMLQEIPEVFDTCNGCGGLWVRFDKGPRLDMVTRRLHECPASKPAPAPRQQIPSIEAPARPALTEIGMEIPR